MTVNPTAPHTIVLIHGLWMTPLSWEDWVDRFTSRGHRVLAPSWPGLDMEIEQLRRDPSPIAPLTITEIVDHYERIIRNLDRPPIIMGHSFGGGFTQVLLDRGLGAAGVAIDSAPSRGVLKVPWSTIRVSWPAVRNPANRHRAVGLTPKQFHFAFTNTLSDGESAKVYERYHVPGAGHVLFEGFLANLEPRSALRVDYRKRDRAPLLFIAGGLDHVVPPAVNRSNVKLYRKGSAIVEYKEFPGRSHYTLGQDGWDEVADYGLRWATERASDAAMDIDSRLVAHDAGTSGRSLTEGSLPAHHRPVKEAYQCRSGRSFKLGIAARSDPNALKLTAGAGAPTLRNRLETRRV